MFGKFMMLHYSYDCARLTDIKFFPNINPPNVETKILSENKLSPPRANHVSLLPLTVTFLVICRSPNRGGSRGRVQGVHTLPEMKPSSYSVLKIVYLTGQ